jgi:hypothetical protein
MSTKPNTGLAAFSRKAVPQAEPVALAAVAAAAPAATSTSSSPAAPQLKRKKLGRGQGESVSLTVRLHRADWERVHQLAVAEGTSIQQLATYGLSKVFAEKGLPALSE